jgi:hypothetical protein
VKNREHACQPLCPSAQPKMESAVAFGLVLGSVDTPRVVQLEHPVSVTRELLKLSEPVQPTEVFRFAAPCAGQACKHFDGLNCSLAQRLVNILPRVTSDLPPCHIRSECRWWLQEGKAACFRCPQVVTETYDVSEDYLRTADV